MGTAGETLVFAEQYLFWTVVIGGAKQAFVLSFFRKGIFELPLLMLANVLWPVYGLMLAEPVMEFLGCSPAVYLYQGQAYTGRRITT